MHRGRVLCASRRADAVDIHHRVCAVANRARCRALAAEPGGPTPLSLARALAAAGGAVEGTAAFLVLEAAKPWSRKTHKYFPAPARARAVELWPWGFRFSRRFPREEQAMFDVWMTIVMPHEITRDYQPPERTEIDEMWDFMSSGGPPRPSGLPSFMRSSSSSAAAASSSASSIGTSLPTSDASRLGNILLRFHSRPRQG